MKIVATKLNEMSQVLFLCGESQRFRMPSFMTEDDEFGSKWLLPEKGQDSWTNNTICDDDFTEDGGIEIDNEISLRRAYELYRV